MQAMTAAAPPHFASRMAIYYFFFFVVGGVHLPFLPVWFAAVGLSPAEIGTCLAVPMAARILIMPFGSWLADRLPSRRAAALGFSAAAMLLFLPAALAPGYWTILVFASLANVMVAMAQPPGEALALAGVRRFGMDYGRVRSLGSVGFICANLASGALYSAFAGGIVLPMLFAALAISAAAALILPGLPGSGGAGPASRRVAGWRSLLNPEIGLIIGAGAMIQASHAQLYGFGTLYWQERGFSGNAIGVLWASGVVAEVVLLFLSGRILGRIRPVTLVGIGAAAAVFRWLVFPFVDHLAAFVALQALHALTFGGTLAGIQHAIAKRVPDARTASAQGLYLMASGLTMAVATQAAGPLYAWLGVHSFLAMAPIAALGLVLIVVLRLFFTPRGPDPGA
ncbi:MFS transporter [Prosthecomicrobium pneumaticum]|uniref:PPP family 3-phenylpropionic acid transporter n=1 Tax=Prosthecomicrobium pneumaticum TaxID=81895 RepID=A0A7W9L401_9HYPH|nr:MFS transporter [Prosthecomicrobium pneumaticum]MBB5755049.1 PPP family 3-phenylpropionic acid transporter [Prosthecomicrobium pneumaticum]